MGKNRGSPRREERAEDSFSSEEDTDTEEAEEEKRGAGKRAATHSEFRDRMKEYKKRLDENVASLTEEELHRYGQFRRTGFNKGGIRRLVGQVLGQSCNPNFTIVLTGIAKVFVGELIEEAKAVQAQWGDRGELLPSHVHESYRRLYHRIPNMSMR